MSTTGVLAKGVFSRQFWTLPRISVVASLLIIATVSTIAVARTQLAIVPIYAAQNHKVDTPFVITLNQRVKSVPVESIRVSPAVAGEWKLKEGTFLTGDSLIFTPTNYFAVDTQYTVAVPTIERVIAGTADGMSIQFKTEHAPSMTDKGLVGLTDNQTIPADYSFGVTLSSPNRELRTLELRTKPELTLTRHSTDDRQFTWRSGQLLPQGKSIQVELYDTKNKTSLLKKTVRIASEPVATAPTKATHYKPGDAVKLTFNAPIRSDQATKITFDTPGKGGWENETTYAFKPSQLKPRQTVTYTASAGIRSIQGGLSTKDRTGSVTAVGAVRVTGSTPQGRDVAQASQRISFTFDQPVDRQSAVERFRLSSGETVRSEWSGNILTMIVKNLGYQRTITASIAPGVKNAGFGLPSTQSFQTTFTTEARSIRLKIPQYQQQHAASCTAASLRMALAYRGVNIGSDMTIVQQMGYNPRAIDKGTNPATWDDPNLMFVGDVNGSIKGGTGAGPDAQPVAKASRALGRNASAVTGIGVNWVAQQLYDGDPVVLFGAINGSGYIEWKTPSGAMTKMHITGHARMVTGVVGEPNNPIGFWVNDPLYGTQYWTARSLAANIALDPYRQAVVVY